MKNRIAQLLRLIMLGLLSIMPGTSVAPAQQADDAAAQGVHSTVATCRTLITVTGEVRAPARIEVRRKTPVRLTEVLALAGGMTELAGKTVRIFHAAQDTDCDMIVSGRPEKSSEREARTLNIADILHGLNDANPTVRPGDIVVVSKNEVAYVVGSVMKPQPIILKEPTTVSQAIAMAGGVSTDARTEKTRIHRFTADSATRISITVNLKAIMKGQAEDIRLQPYDVVDVPGKREHPVPPLYLKVAPPPVPALSLRVIY